MGVPDLASLSGFAGGSLLTLILVEIIKRAWKPTADQSDRFLPLISVGVGILVVLFALFGLGTLTQEVLFQGVITGVFAGVSASGTFSLVKGVADT